MLLFLNVVIFVCILVFERERVCSSFVNRKRVFYE